jgi:hypothetical protein
MTGAILGTVANRLSTDGTIVDLQKDGTTVGSIGTTGGDMYIGTGDCAIRFSDGGDQIRVSTAAGSNRDAAVDLGFSDSRFKDLYLSGGVYLGGTGAANKLDDYERGTWTPTFMNTGVTTAPSVTTGRYTKVGDIVYVDYYASGITLDAAGSMRMGGLPFTVADSGSYSTFHYVHGSASGSTTTGGYFVANNTQMQFVTQGSTSAASWSTQSVRYLMVSGWYHI